MVVSISLSIRRGSEIQQSYDPQNLLRFQHSRGLEAAITYLLPWLSLNLSLRLLHQSFHLIPHSSLPLLRWGLFLHAPCRCSLRARLAHVRLWFSSCLGGSLGLGLSSCRGRGFDGEELARGRFACCAAGFAGAGHYLLIFCGCLE